jgi:hypothetical protein
MSTRVRMGLAFNLVVLVGATVVSANASGFVPVLTESPGLVLFGVGLLGLAHLVRRREQA